MRVVGDATTRILHPNRRGTCPVASRSGSLAPTGSRFPSGGIGPALALEASPQRVHQIDDVAGLCGATRRFDRLARGFAPDQRAERNLVPILEMPRVEMAGLRIQDVLGELNHVPADAGVGHIGEIVLLAPDLVVVAKNRAQNA